MARPRKEGLRFARFRYSRAPENRVRRPERLILAVIGKLQGFHRKHYAFPAQETIVAFLARWYGVAMGRRTLNRHLNALQQGHWVSRTRRHEYRRHRGLLFRSTLYRLTARDRALAFNRALACARALSRVPEAAQYLRSFIEDLSSAAGLSTTRPPPNPKSRPPRKRGG
jgi:hypothetical protein